MRLGEYVQRVCRLWRVEFMLVLYEYVNKTRELGDWVHTLCSCSKTASITSNDVVAEQS